MTEDLRGISTELIQAIELLLESYSRSENYSTSLVSHVESVVNEAANHIDVLEVRVIELLNDNERNTKYNSHDNHNNRNFNDSLEIVSPSKILNKLTQSEALVMQENELNSLKQVIESSDKQIAYLRNERDKVTKSHKEIIEQFTNEINALKNKIQMHKKESVDDQYKLNEKESMLQVALAQLASTQDELKLSKQQNKIKENELKETSPYKKVIGSSSKSSNKNLLNELNSLRMAKDALRTELYTERKNFSIAKAQIVADLTIEERKSKALNERLDAMKIEALNERSRAEDNILKLQISMNDIAKKESDLKMMEVYKDGADNECNRQKQLYFELQSTYKKQTASMIEKERAYEESNKSLRDNIHLFRVGLNELQRELLVQSEIGQTAIEKVSTDHNRITQRLEALVAQNESLWKSTHMQDKLLRSSGEMITSLTSKLYNGSPTKQSLSMNSSSMDVNADEELVISRHTRILMDQLKAVDDKWASRLDYETQELRNNLVKVQQQLCDEIDEKKALTSSYAIETEEVSNQLETIQNRVVKLTHENLELRKELASHTGTKQLHIHSDNYSSNSNSTYGSDSSSEVLLLKTQLKALKQQLEEALHKLHSANVDNDYIKPPSPSPSPSPSSPKVYQSTAVGNQFNPMDGHTVEYAIKLKMAETKVICLMQQLSSMPSSLQVACAEKRVIESKMAKMLEIAEAKMEAMKHDSEKMSRDLQIALSIEASEKEALLEKVKEQAQTIHQLTLSIKVSEATAHANRSDGRSNNCDNRRYVQEVMQSLPPPPWTLIDRTNVYPSASPVVVTPQTRSSHLHHHHTGATSAATTHTFQDTLPRWGAVTGKSIAFSTFNESNGNKISEHTSQQQQQLLHSWFDNNYNYRYSNDVTIDNIDNINSSAPYDTVDDGAFKKNLNMLSLYQAAAAM